MSTHTVDSDVHRGISKVEVIVPDVRRDVSNTRPTVFDVRGDITNTRATVSGIHRDKLKGRGNSDAQNQAVGIARILPVIA